MTATLEHANVTVSDPHATAAWMCDLFGWHIRWQGAAKETGITVHVGTDNLYLALYSSQTPQSPAGNTYTITGGLNHLAVVVDDLAAMREKVKKAGFSMGETYDYEPGLRFYFDDHDGIEYEIVEYT